MSTETQARGWVSDLSQNGYGYIRNTQASHMSLSLLNDNDNDHLFSHLSLCTHSSDFPCVPECVGLGPFVDRRIARSVQKKTKTKCLDPLRVALVEVSQQTKDEKTCLATNGNRFKANKNLSCTTNGNITNMPSRADVEVYRHRKQKLKYAMLESQNETAAIAHNRFHAINRFLDMSSGKPRAAPSSIVG